MLQHSHKSTTVNVFEKLFLLLGFCRIFLNGRLLAPLPQFVQNKNSEECSICCHNSLQYPRHQTLFSVSITSSTILYGVCNAYKRCCRNRNVTEVHKICIHQMQTWAHKSVQMILQISNENDNCHIIWDTSNKNDSDIKRPPRPFFRDHPGEPVPEENFWTSWCKGRSRRQTHRPSGWAPLHPD